MLQRLERSAIRYLQRPDHLPGQSTHSLDNLPDFLNSGMVHMDAAGHADPHIQRRGHLPGHFPGQFILLVPGHGQNGNRCADPPLFLQTRSGFGQGNGSDMFPVLHPTKVNTVGRQNIAMAQQLLQEEGLVPRVADVGGRQGRKLIFYPHTGEVFLKRLKKTWRDG